MKKFSHGPKVFIAIVTIGLLHFLGLIFYASFTQEQSFSISRSKAFDEVVNIISNLKSVPSDQDPLLLKQFYKTHLQLSLTNKPEWPVQIKDERYWLLETILKNKSLQFSYLVRPNQWLNIYFQGNRHASASQILMLILEGLLLAVIIYALWMFDRFNYPLKQFKKVADALGIDTAHTPIKEYGPRTVREMARAMNDLHTRIRELLKERTEILVAISHDLRTPLTRLKLRAQLTNDLVCQSKTIYDIDEMEQMIEQILYFARPQQNAQNNKIDLRTLLMTLCDEMQDMGMPIDFISDTNPVKINGHALSLKRAINNILQNSQRYAKKITVTLLNENQNIKIIIEDDGPGIPTSDLEKVLQPFYRVNQARTAGCGNVGLGLSITRDIIHKQSGTLHLENCLPHGLRVIICFEGIPNR